MLFTLILAKTFVRTVKIRMSRFELTRPSYLKELQVEDPLRRCTRESYDLRLMRMRLTKKVGISP
jgi:hypothetical protein